MNYRCHQICAYKRISDRVQTVYELPLPPNNTASETFLHKSGAVQSVDWIFIIGVPAPPVTGRIRDIGQNVLQSSFETGSSSSHSYLHIFFLITFFKEALIRNIIIITCISYLIIIHVDNAVINNNYGRLQDLIWPFKISVGKRKFSSKFIDNLDTSPQNVSLALV
jgi:hypothetical protein